MIYELPRDRRGEDFLDAEVGRGEDRSLLPEVGFCEGHEEFVQQPLCDRSFVLRLQEPDDEK
jgi:hypothetical protein